jgi:hypothetical protein
MRRKRLLLFIIVGVILVTFRDFLFSLDLKYSRMQKESFTMNLEIAEETATIVQALTPHNQTKHILFYTRFWKNNFWHIGNETVGNEHPHFQRCSRRNCIFTNRYDFLPSLSDYDALIFHTGEGWWVNKSYCKVPDERKPNQLYIVAVQECVFGFNFRINYKRFVNFRPPLRTMMLHKFNGKFYNLTMTYSLDADIQFGYGGIADISTGDKIAPARNITWKQPEEDFEGFSIILGH